MIKKIIRIKNIGKFTNYAAAGDVEFKKLTLIYAENGRGKTTLCDLLRSLQTGNADYILGRKTLGVGGNPEVCIRLDSGNAEFQGGAWPSSCPETMIFDSAFVHSNVYAGDYVDHEHKKSLYRVIVGEKGVQLARRVEELDGLSRDASREITEKKTVFQKFVPAGFTIETFQALEDEVNIDKKITDQAEVVKAFEQVSEIKSKSILKIITSPSIPARFASLLLKTLKEISREAELRVRTHIQSHLDEVGESWIAQGIDYIKENTCGFCGQRLDGNELITAYQEYFSAAYQKLKEEVTTLEAEVGEQLGEQTLLRLQRKLNENEVLVRFWEQFVEVNLSPIIFDELRQPLDGLRAAARTLLDRKKASLLEAIAPDEAFLEAERLYREAGEKVSEYNISIGKVNDLIKVKKAATASGTLDEARKSLERYKAIKRRYEAEVVKASDAYRASLEKKKNLEVVKEKVREELDTYSNAIFDKYQKRINELLAMFNAGFRIADTKGQYVGGTASSSYRIL